MFKVNVIPNEVAQSQSKDCRVISFLT